jgi:hypothetical protein
MNAGNKRGRADANDVKEDDENMMAWESVYKFKISLTLLWHCVKIVVYVLELLVVKLFLIAMIIFLTHVQNIL